VYMRTPEGWNLLTHCGYRGGRGINLLNCDIPVDHSQSFAAKCRDGVIAAAQHLESRLGVPVPVLPITNQALRAMAARYQEPNVENVWGWAARTITVVHQEGWEAVFRVEDNGHEHYYLSAFDRQETPPLYFLCQLPGKVDTIADAREALKPESVRRALAEGLSVKRQGDLFAIETGFSKSDLTSMGARFVPQLKLYGTNHVSEGAVLPNGLQLAFNGMRHSPENRPVDHAPVVWAGWRYIMKNTVPVQGTYRPEGTPEPAVAPQGSDVEMPFLTDELRAIVWNRMTRDHMLRDMRSVMVETWGGEPVRTSQAEADLERERARARSRAEILARRQEMEAERQQILEELVRSRRSRWRFWR